MMGVAYMSILCLLLCLCVLCHILSLPYCAGLVSSEDTVCVIGSSHSAILVLINLLEMEDGPKVLNLYRSPLRYAKYLPDGRIVLDNYGLKVCTSKECISAASQPGCVWQARHSSIELLKRNAWLLAHMHALSDLVCA